MKLDLDGLYKKRVCVAVSGGRDSVCLLHALLSAAEGAQIAVSALTCEHGIRGAASEEDLAFVIGLCDRWDVPLDIFRADVPALARAEKIGLEEAGRRFRYACYSRVLAEGKADMVATAHHLGDAAETALFRLARGTSLAGMDVFPAREGIVRPLKNTPRAEIEAYVAAHALPFREDGTNADVRFSRNRIRLEVLPALEKAAHGAAEHIAAFAARAAEDDKYLQAEAAKALCRRAGAVCVPLSLPVPLFSRAVLAALRACGVQKDYTSADVAAAARLKTLQSGKRVTLSGGAEGVREGEYIAFYRPSAAPLSADAAAFPFGFGTFPMGEYTGMVGTEEAEGALVADLGAFPAGCVVRTRREGDLIKPPGGGTKTLKKFLTEKKIPARIGRALPLIACGSEVLAVFSVGIAEEVRVTEKTVRRAYLTLSPRGEGEHA